MKRALAILVGVAMVCVVAYLSWLNPTEVEVRFSPHGRLSAPLGVFLIVAFLTGVLVVLAAVMIQAGWRAFVTWWRGREQKRSERIDAWEDEGERLVWAGQTQQGRALLQKAWRRSPDRAAALLALAVSYRDTGELQRARQLLTDAADQHHTNPDVLLALAETHRAAGERAPYVETLERLRALHPRAPRVLRALRDAYVEGARWQDALTTQQALLGELRESDQAAGEREYLSTLAYQAALAVPEASARVQALEALADNRSPSLPVLVSLGDALRAEGRDDEASVLWERALRGTPRSVLAERLAAMATEPRHRDRLRALLRKLRTDHVRPDNVHLLAAQLFWADGNVDDTARELEALQDLAGAPAAAHRLWGEVHQRRGQAEQAIAAFAQASTAAPAYHCVTCERGANEWVGYCPQCGSWDSYRSAIEIAAC